MSNASDYVLELGWDASEANTGLTNFEKRLNQLAASAAKLGGLGRTPSSVPRQPRGSKDDSVVLEQRRLNILNAIEVRENRIRAIKDSVNTKTKSGKALAAELDMSIRKVKEFKAQVRSTKVSSNADILSLRKSQSRFNVEINESIRRVNKLNRRVGALGNIGRRAAASFTSFAAAGVGAYAIANIGRAAYRAAKDMQSMEVAMQAAFGSEKVAAEQMEYTRSVAKKYALDISAAGDGWAKIALSAKASGMPMKDAQEIFENTALAARGFNLSADDTKGTFRAIMQMMGKGKVNAEDMRQQLAERIPAAMPILAKSMGKTYAEMEEMMARGEIGAEALVGWSKEMSKMVKESGAYEKSMKTLSAGQAIFTNALKEAALVLFSGKLDYALGSLMTTMGAFFESNQTNMRFLGDIFGDVVSGIEWVFKTFSPLISRIVTGYRLMYDEYMKATSLSIYDAYKKGGLVWFLNTLHRLIQDVIAGWEMLIDVVSKGDLGKGLEQIKLIHKVESDKTNEFNKKHGRGYYDEAGNWKQNIGGADYKKSQMASSYPSSKLDWPTGAYAGSKEKSQALPTQNDITLIINGNDTQKIKDTVNDALDNRLYPAMP